MIKPLTLIAPQTETSAAETLPKSPSPTAEAAQQFEQIFLRKLLSQLMQTAKLGGKSQAAGSGVYDSMVVDAMATTLSNKGGIGLAEIIQKRLESHPDAAAAVSQALPANEQAPAQRLDKVLKIHSSTDPSDRLFPTEAKHLSSLAPRRTR